MIYKGVEFTVTAVAPGIWKWQFRIGDRLGRLLREERPADAKGYDVARKRYKGEEEPEFHRALNSA